MIHLSETPLSIMVWNGYDLKTLGWFMKLNILNTEPHSVLDILAETYFHDRC
jgi:hypothetical protein